MTPPVDGVRLSTFVQVARYGSISAAARALGMTASAVSQQMALLESQCGVPLLERQPRGVMLTGAGESLLTHAEDVVRALEETGTKMAQLSGKVAGRVRVGSIASAAAAVVLPAIRVLATSAPDVAMSISTVEPSSSIDAVISGPLDIGVIDVYDHVPVPETFAHPLSGRRIEPHERLKARCRARTTRLPQHCRVGRPALGVANLARRSPRRTRRLIDG